MKAGLGGRHVAMGFEFVWDSREVALYSGAVEINRV